MAEEILRGVVHWRSRKYCRSRSLALYDTLSLHMVRKKKWLTNILTGDEEGIPGPTEVLAPIPNMVREVGALGR